MKHTYDRLIELLDSHHANYRLIDHAPEGRTEIVSPMRGNKLSQAAKCMVLAVHLGGKQIKYVLGVVPGDKKIDFDADPFLHVDEWLPSPSEDIPKDLAHQHNHYLYGIEKQ